MKVICISGKAGSGKDAVAEIMRKQIESLDKKVMIAHYADLVKYIAKTFFSWDGKKDEHGRELLQRIGTDIVRKKNPTYWVDFMISIMNMFGDNWDYFIIPDCRFFNEVDSLIKDGFHTEIIRVERPNYTSLLTKEQQNHPSETEMDDYKYDYVIVNDGTVENLKLKIKTLLKEIIRIE